MVRWGTLSLHNVCGNFFQKKWSVFLFEILHVKYGFEPCLKGPILGGLSYGSKVQFWGVWAMIQSIIIGGFTSWLKVLFFGVWAMTLSSIIDRFEPWLKVLLFWDLNHGIRCPPGRNRVKITVFFWSLP